MEIDETFTHIGDNLQHGVLNSRTYSWLESTLNREYFLQYLNKLSEVCSINLCKYESIIEQVSRLMNNKYTLKGEKLASEEKKRLISIVDNYNTLHSLQLTIFKNTFDECGLALMEMPNIEEALLVFEEFKINFNEVMIILRRHSER